MCSSLRTARSASLVCSLESFYLQAGTDHDAGMGVSVSASRGAGDRAGTIIFMMPKILACAGRKLNVRGVEYRASVVRAREQCVSWSFRVGFFGALWRSDFTSRRRPVDRNEEALTSLIVLRGPAPKSLVARGNWSGRLLSEVWENRAWHSSGPTLFTVNITTNITTSPAPRPHH